MEALSSILLAAGIVLVLIAHVRRSGGRIVRPWTKIVYGIGIAFIAFALVERAPDFVRWFMSGWNAFQQ